MSNKIKSFCEICKTEIELRFCCSEFDCGCMGLPVDPPVCSKECDEKFFEKIKQEGGQNV